MCKHVLVARQPTSYGASYLCDRCGAFIRRCWPVKEMDEDTADYLDIVETVIIEPYKSKITGFEFPFLGAS